MLQVNKNGTSFMFRKLKMCMQNKFKLTYYQGTSCENRCFKLSILCTIQATAEANNLSAVATAKDLYTKEMEQVYYCFKCISKLKVG